MLRPGIHGGAPTSFYDSFGIEDGKIADRRDSIETNPADAD